MNTEHLPLFLLLAGLALISDFLVDAYITHTAAAPKAAATDPQVQDDEAAAGAGPLQEMPMTKSKFESFQRNYLAVLLTMQTADWLQGPYLYALYESYELSSRDIGSLFLTGFAVSGFIGVYAGSFADATGRKLSCLLFAVFYSISCIAIHFNHFHILMIGRVAGGLGTSLLFTVFDAWMVHEHRSRCFPQEWIKETFAKAAFGNGLVAIAAGVMASVAAETYGKTSPFKISTLFLLLGCVVIATTWNENYGAAQSPMPGGEKDVSNRAAEVSSFHVDEDLEARGLRKSFVGVCRTMGSSLEKSLSIIKGDARVFWCCMLQSSFEGSMFMFVLGWTPSIGSALNHGMIFAIFMTAVMGGSQVFTLLNAKGVSMPSILMGICCVSCFSFLVVASNLGSSLNIVLISFVIFEIQCGTYFPAFYSIRAAVLPAEARATSLNLFRLPLNVAVILGCVAFPSVHLSAIFLYCAALQAFGALAAFKLSEA